MTRFFLRYVTLIGSTLKKTHGLVLATHFGYDVKTKISHQFLGTLISRLAFWIISEEKCLDSPLFIKNFNYVACHSKGMTGYYVTEALFKTEYNNPLAPVYIPGKEVENIFRLLDIDWPRRVEHTNYPDPVCIAAISTEIGKMLNWKNFHDGQREIRIERLNDVAGAGIIPNDFLFTAIVARKSTTDAQEIADASQYLREGVIESIRELRVDPNKFSRSLAAFYSTHASFLLPGKNNPFLLKREIKKIVANLGDLYPKTGLCAPVEAMTGTNDLLCKAIKHDLMPGAAQTVIDDHFNNLQTNSWDAGGTLWS